MKRIIKQQWLKERTKAVIYEKKRHQKNKQNKPEGLHASRVEALYNLSEHRFDELVVRFSSEAASICNGFTGGYPA